MFIFYKGYKAVITETSYKTYKFGAPVLMVICFFAAILRTGAFNGLASLGSIEGNVVSIIFCLIEIVLLLVNLALYVFNYYKINKLGFLWYIYNFI